VSGKYLKNERVVSIFCCKNASCSQKEKQKRNREREKEREGGLDQTGNARIVDKKRSVRKDRQCDAQWKKKMRPSEKTHGA